MNTKKRFQCLGCGKCCKNSRGRLGELGKNKQIPPFVQEYTSRYKATISLHEWELAVLSEQARKYNIALKIVPYLAIWDVINRLPIALNWTLDHDNCPFLSKDNRCIINDNKPLVCRAYPLHAYGLVKEQPGKVDIDHGDCPTAVVFDKTDTLEKIMYSDLLRNLFAAYGPCLIAMLQEDAAVSVEADTLKNMSTDCEVYPELMNKDTEALIRSKKPVGLFEVVKRKKPASYNQLTKQIKEIYYLKEADLERMLASR